MGDTFQSRAGRVHKPTIHGRSGEGATGGFHQHARRSKRDQDSNRITISAKPSTNNNSRHQSIITEHRSFTSSSFPRRKPSTLRPGTRQKSETARRLDMGRGDEDEDEELARAIALSLADMVAFPHTTDPATDAAADPVTNPATSPTASPLTSPLTGPVTSPAINPATDPVAAFNLESNLAIERSHFPFSKKAGKHIDPATSPAIDPATDPAAAIASNLTSDLTIKQSLYSKKAGKQPEPPGRSLVETLNTSLHNEDDNEPSWSRENWSRHDDDRDEPTPVASFSRNSPRDRLIYIHRDMTAAIAQLEARARQQNPLDPGVVATRITQWQRQIYPFMYLLNAAENQRERDIKESLALDREIEEKHEGELDQMYNTWQTVLAGKEKAWESRMETQKLKYEALLAGHNITEPAASQEEHHSPSPRAKTPSPPPHPAASRLQDINILKKEHADAIEALEACHASELNEQKKWIDRLIQGRLELLGYKHDVPLLKRDLQSSKEMYEERIAELEAEVERLRKENQGMKLSCIELLPGPEQS